MWWMAIPAVVNAVKSMQAGGGKDSDVYSSLMGNKNIAQQAPEASGGGIAEALKQILETKEGMKKQPSMNSTGMDSNALAAQARSMGYGSADKARAEAGY